MNRVATRRDAGLVLLLGVVALVGTRSLWLSNSFYGFVFVSGWWLLCSLLLSGLTRSKLLRRLGLVLAGLSLGLLVAESHAASAQRTRTVRTPEYIQRDPILGYAPRADTVARVEKSLLGEPVYKVVYSFDQHGLRLVPTPAQPSASNVLFYGGSFVMGEGVADSECLPAQLQILSEGRLRAHNMAFHGYGPQQMLASLQNQREGYSVGEAPVALAVYGALLPEHFQRVAGRTTWDLEGPNYQVKDGGALYAGPFRAPWRAAILKTWSKSHFFRRYLKLQIPANDPEQNRDRFLAVVEASQKLVKERYGADFLVILWSPSPEMSERVSQLLGERGIEAVGVHTIMPDFFSNTDYQLKSPVEQHPSALAHRRIAEYLLQRLSP